MITGTRYMIAAGHYLAAEAGHAILRQGGNAVDAGVAAGIALGVAAAQRHRRVRRQPRALAGREAGCVAGGRP
jgi:hypothetical protein